MTAERKFGVLNAIQSEYAETKTTNAKYRSLLPKVEAEVEAAKAGGDKAKLLAALEKEGVGEVLIRFNDNKLVELKGKYTEALKSYCAAVVKEADLVRDEAINTSARVAMLSHDPLPPAAIAFLAGKGVTVDLD